MTGDQAFAASLAVIAFAGAVMGTFARFADEEDAALVLPGCLALLACFVLVGLMGISQHLRWVP